jgi:hypothetical protein
MPFFQNVFTNDFEGNWLISDRRYVPKFVLRRNAGRGDEYVVSWNAGPYNLSGNDADGNTRDTLEIVYALYNFKNWATISVDISAGAASTSAVTPEEIVANLNGNTLFAERFTASLDKQRLILIRQNKPALDFRFYIQNGRAEEALRFNARAGVAELPTYFSRHTIENRFDFEDSANQLIQLDSTSSVQADIIDNAVDYKGISLGYDSSVVQEDWELMDGKHNNFHFQSGPSDGTVDSTATTLIYPTGSRVGDLAKKVIILKDSTGEIVQQFEMPYTLTISDMISPP